VTGPINKTMDRDDLHTPAARAVVRELDGLVRDLSRRGLRASSWYGTLDLDRFDWERANRGYGYTALDGAGDDCRFPWFLYWEIAWVVLHSEFQPGDRVLDLGGSSSLFSYYLAARGLEVTTVDIDRELVANADEVAACTGWRLTNRVMDLRRLDLDAEFEHVTSICVFEHIPVCDRIDVSSSISALLVEGGTFTMTFDYLNPSRLARISSPSAVHEQFIRPSGLAVRGNHEFHDNGKRYLLSAFYHRDAWRAGWKLDRLRRRQFRLRDLWRARRRRDYTFGALFLEKRPAD
jgi:2-polyprenyl-3-methyl-5-hydroxy-6-metoxy-1,4-benzoquinol methylase